MSVQENIFGVTVMLAIALVTLFSMDLASISIGSMTVPSKTVTVVSQSVSTGRGGGAVT